MPTTQPETIPAEELPVEELPAEEVIVTPEPDMTELALRRLGYSVAAELPEEDELVVDPELPPEEAEVAAELPPEELPPEAPVVRAKRRAVPAVVPQASNQDIIKGLTEALRQSRDTPAPAVAAAAQTIALPKLNEYDADEVELAEFAAKTMPDKYAGAGSKALEYINKRDRKISEIIKEEGEFDPNSDDYRAFVTQNRPVISVGDRSKLTRERIKQEVMAEATRHFDEKQKEIDRKIRQIESTPKIKHALSESMKTALSVDDDAVKAYLEDPNKSMEDNPFETPVIMHVEKEAQSMTSEFLNIASGLIDPDSSNPLHVKLNEFIENQGKLIDAAPEERRVTSDGKVLVSRSQYARLSAEGSPNLGRYTPLSDSQVTTLMGEYHKNLLSGYLKTNRDRLTKAGYQRAAKAPPAAVTPQKVVAAAPVGATNKPKVAPRAVAAPRSAPAAPASSSGSAPHLKALGYS